MSLALSSGMEVKWVIGTTIFDMVAGYVILLLLYRHLLHPLAAYPGPRLAGLSRWYAFYYEVVLKGQFTFHIQALHRQYGPDEIHIEDSDFYEELYARSGRLERDPQMSPFFGNSASLFSAEAVELHRIRRAPLAPLFSRKRTLELQSLVQGKVRKLLRKLEEFQAGARPLKIDQAYMALSEDVMTQYCFGRCYDKIDAPDFQDNLHDSMRALIQTGWTAVHFPWVPKLLVKIPPDILVRLEPRYSAIFQLQKDIRRWALEVQEDSVVTKIDEPQRHAAVLNELVSSDLPASEKLPTRIGDEAQNLLGAGVTTTGWVATVTTFHIVQNQAVFHKLRRELEEAFPHAGDCLDLLKLEKLPYLQACLQEGLRMATGMSTRSPRISNQSIMYKHWRIPPRTSISMSIIDVSFDAHVFPEPHVFRPERWMGPTRPGDKYFVFFGKGTRSCLGMQLAYAKLYLLIGGLFRKFELELYQTDVSDVEIAHDFFLPIPRLNSPGVRVKVKS